MATGTYAINGVEFLVPPTAGRWIKRSPVGITGDGHEIYPRTREFECLWGVGSPDIFHQIYDYFQRVGISGTVTVTLPEFGAAVYEFKNYSGCIVSDPGSDVYFSEHYTQFTVLIRNVVT